MIQNRRLRCSATTC